MYLSVDTEFKISKGLIYYTYDDAKLAVNL